MNRSSSTGEATQVAQLTPAISAAIATLAVRGPMARQVVEHFFHTASGRTAQWRAGDVRFGLWTLHGSGAPPEHVVITHLADQQFEIHCHGGLAVTEWILGDLEASGCVIVMPDQWPTSRSGRIEAAAELALVNAATIKVAAVLLDQFNGSLTREFHSIALAIAASDCARARESCQALLRRTGFGMKLTKPWRLTLAGPPNVGKSSLTNALVGAARVLVHHEPGTTRDAIETSIVIASWPLVLTDTAGVRDSDEGIERQGIDAARQRWRQADIGLLVIDATIGWTHVHSELVKDRSGAMLLVLNKSDLNSNVALPHESLTEVSGLCGLNGPVKMVATAATGPAGVAQLIDALGGHFDALMPPAGASVPFLEEHLALLSELDQLLADGKTDLAQAAIASYLGGADY